MDGRNTNFRGRGRGGDANRGRGLGRNGGGRGRGYQEQQGNQAWRPAASGRPSDQPPPPPPLQKRVYRPSPPPERRPIQSTGGSGELTKPVVVASNAVEKRLGAVSISEPQIQSSSSSSTSEDKLVPVKRPDKGSRAGKPIRLLVNHFPVSFNPNSTIIHYHLDVKQVSSSNQPVKRLISKSDLALIREKLFSDDPRFPMDKTAYDGEKSIFSTVELPIGQFEVKLLDGDRVVPRAYTITIKAVNELKLSKLKDYLNGSLPYIPRDILQGMDLVMKDNPSRTRISSGRSFYSKEFRRGDDFYNGVAAYRGFQQGLKSTGQGLVLCLDFCVMPFHKPMPVLDFLMEHVRGFSKADDVLKLKQFVIESLKGLKVTVTHRRTKQKYTIMGLSAEKTCDIFFDLEDLDGNNPPTRVGLVNYFRDKYDGYKIKYPQIPCLDIGRGKRRNYVPLELCEVVVGQRYPKEYLNRNNARLLKEISLPPPMERKRMIIDIMRSEDGPSGVVTENFGFGLSKNMTTVMGRVLTAPYLKLASQDGQARKVSVDSAKAHWNLTDKSVSEGKSLDRWVLIDFGAYLDTDGFVMKLKKRCGRLGMSISNPAGVHRPRMQMLSSVDSLEKFLNDVVQEAGRASNLKLQMIVCAMADKHDGYKYLKWLETRIGVVTQCCLSELANKANDQYLANLALKINAKLGGSNVELVEGVPYFRDADHVMFIGADVNHPAARNETCPSIAAVVGSINWPVANQYAARICPQNHRKEKIVTFGAMCLELVNAYHRCNGVKPLKIVLFRDGVSEGQFDMVLNEELLDLKKTFQELNYYPMITVVVAQKRHQTRLFLDGNEVGGRPLGNVPPGTVVDSTVVHPFEFDFYCVSHYGGLGTSKPTHYYCLWDENQFTSESLQKLVYYLCFTFARCTKPVSLVPPVYYADLVAFRGRLFQEVEMERSSADVGSFDSSFYNQHPDLRNIMFFV